MSKEKKKSTKKTEQPTKVAGYYCPECLAGGFAPDEMAVTRDGRALCLDCARWGAL
jgi:hypothetical protein